MNTINIKLGIIYYIDDLILHERVNYIEYIKIKDYSEIKETKRPTLIIGWNIVKNKYTSINILNKKINNNLFWCFSFNEKKSDYIDNINKFTKTDILEVFSSFEYIILSPILNNDLKTEQNYIDYFTECDLNNIYVSPKKELSVLCNNTIYKLNLSELDFYKIKPFFILEFLSTKYTNFYYDRNGNIEKMYLEYFKGIDEVFIKKYIPLYNKIILYKK
jgi:hypothetical protein